MAIRSINPTTGRILKIFRNSTRKEASARLEKTARAYESWRAAPINQRAVVLTSVANLLRDRKDQLSKLITLEMGKPISQSIGEIEKCAWVCDYFAENAERFLTDELVGTEARKSYIRFDPLGAILAVMPWNFPFWQVFRFAAPALMAGNVVVLKHASNVPQCALAIEELFAKASAPEGVFSTLLADAKLVETLISDPRIAGVTLTGSDAAGRHIGQTAGRSLKKGVMELGGSDPFIVLDDADLNQSASMAAYARTINTGQSCIAAKRFIVQKSVAKDFSRLLVAHMQALKIGDPLDASTQMGPLARRDLVESLHKQVMRSVKKGAVLLTGGKPLLGGGFYYAPTVLTRVTKGMPAYDEEVFGPVASVITARNDGEMIRIANDSRYGLGASIWTSNLDRAEQIAKALEVGCVFINDFVKSDPRLPFGGVKDSGYGRELGSYGIKEFTNIKTITIK